MDINEWEILSDDEFLDGDEKQIFFEKRTSISDSISVFDKDYFCTSPKSTKTIESPKAPKLLIHVPIQFEPIIHDKVPNKGSVKENTELIEVPRTEGLDRDSVSQVFFHMKENKFVDMKLESPKSSSGRGMVPSLGEDMEMMTSPRRKNMEMENKVVMYYDEENEGEDMNGGFNLWKWSLTGVGAICSFGVAAATICVLFFGSQQRNNKVQPDQNIRFHFYTDDKRIKQVVQHATKLNEAFAAVRGVPLSRAHIAYGGYYENVS